MLTPTGTLVGSPGEAGVFTFKVKAADAHPAGARTAEKAFSWTIGPISSEALAVKCLMKKDSSALQREKLQDDTFAIDGKLDEPFWKLDQAIGIAVSGKPAQKASFGVLWTAEPSTAKQSRKKTGSASGKELLLGVKVFDGPKGKSAKDGIHLHIDARHDGTKIYSADDTHLFIPRAGTQGSSGALSLCGKPTWWMKAAVTEIEGGYSVEISLTPNYFEGDGNWVTFGEKGVYGFDIGVEEGDSKESARQVWHGDAGNDTDTSRFGTIVLVDKPAASPTGAAKKFTRAASGK